MTCAAKHTSVRATPRQRAQGSVTRFPSVPEPDDSRLSHALSETMIERLLKRNDVVLLMECDQRVRRVPYRGKQRRNDVLRFLRIAGPQTRALVYSHQTEEGPVWIDVMSGEVSAW
jgi:hypothetical protein